MALLAGKKIVILGLANEKSIAYGIAKALRTHGASIALSFQNEQLQKRVEPLAMDLGADFIFEMDVTQDDHYPRMRETIIEKWGRIDGIVHSLAFADREDLKNTFSQTTRKGFALACDISAYSFVGISNTLKDLLNKGGSIFALTYHGSQKVTQGYNVMGVAKAALEASMRYLADDLGPLDIKVNCISAGYIRTLASSAVKGAKEMLSLSEQKAPLRRSVSPEDVGGTAVYLMSSLSNNVTGQVLYVDAGISIMT